MRFPFGDVLNSSQFDIVIYSRFVVSNIHDALPTTTLQRLSRSSLLVKTSSPSPSPRSNQARRSRALWKTWWNGAAGEDSLWIPAHVFDFFRALAYPYDRWLRGLKSFLYKWVTKHVLNPYDILQTKTTAPIEHPFPSNCHLVLVPTPSTCNKVFQIQSKVTAMLLVSSSHDGDSTQHCKRVYLHKSSKVAESIYTFIQSSMSEFHHVEHIMFVFYPFKSFTSLELDWKLKSFQTWKFCCTGLFKEWGLSSGSRFWGSATWWDVHHSVYWMANWIKSDLLDG